jgi:hypothetical protein|tara:strand:+ start:609 stop:812 length:204 start_codon:yes stop_codon:yes gene_type:complete
MERALTKERVMKMYNVLQSSLYGELVQVAAKNEEEALRLVENGDYFNRDIIATELVNREITGDVEEE